MFYKTNRLIQLQQKKYIFIQQNIFIQLFKFPDIDKFLFNKAPPPYPPAAPFLKTWKQHIYSSMVAQEQHFNKYFADIVNLLNVCEEDNSISQQFIEWFINRLNWQPSLWKMSCHS